MKIDGQCHCGAVRYEAEIDPEDVAVCHCTDCQQLTGSAYRVTTFSARKDFRITAGAPKTYVKRGANGRIRYQMFCSDCGSPLYTTGTDEDAEEIGIRVGTITQRRGLLPKGQFWCSSALPWVDALADVPGRERD